MYELKLSTLFSKQIKKVAQRSQPTFLDICESWDKVHKAVNNFGEIGNPFQIVRFAKKVNGRRLYIVYILKEDKKELWVEAIVVKKSKGSFVTYRL